MINKERFEAITKGNFILFTSGKVRKVIQVIIWNSKDKKRVLLTFTKTNGIGQTVYMYADLKNKIQRIFKIKK